MLKVGYTIADGKLDRISTAYLNDKPLEDGSYVGTNKHTDLPVHLAWHDTKTGSGWYLVCVRTWDYKDVLNETWEERIDERSKPDCICLKEDHD